MTEPQVLDFPAQVFVNDSREQTGELSALPRLWATRKIGYLLNQIRLNGPNQETIDQIVRLSVRYGIITPYTSYLVTEDMPLGASEQEKIAQDAFESAKAAPMAPSGEDAFNRAVQEGNCRRRTSLPSRVRMGRLRSSWLDSVLSSIRESTWIDTAYDAELMQPVIVPFLSDEYFELANSRADVSAALALGQNVIVVVDGKAYQVGVTAQVKTPEAAESSPTPGSQDPAQTPAA